MHLIRQYVQALLVEAREPVRVPLDLHVPDDLTRIYEIMKQAGKQLYVVGGAVRDTLMNKVPKDYDLATDAKAEDVSKILKATDPTLDVKVTGKFQIARVMTPEGNEYEITTFRKDIGKGRRPDSVEITTIDKDVERRDLTINALMYDLDTREVVDYVGGIQDIENQTIRAVTSDEEGDAPGRRFEEDPLRTLRAVRFAARMGSDIEPETKEAIIAHNDLSLDPDMSDDRITGEFIKGLTSAQDAVHYINLLLEVGLLSQVFPGLDVRHTAAVTSNNVPVQLAFLLGNNDVERLGTVLKKMRYDRRKIDTVKFLINLSNINRTTATKLKKGFKRIGSPNAIVEEFSTLGGLPPNTSAAFLEFASALPAVSSQELMQQGLKGEEIGQAQAKADEEAYAAMIGEIRVYIRKLLKEGANDVADLEAHDLYVTIKQNPEEHFGTQIYYSDSKAISRDIDPSASIVGEIALTPSAAEGMACDDAWQIEYTGTTGGWGPLLYDVAMEFATLNGGGLTPDRVSVSSDAKAVWDYYLSNRGNVASHQLDKQPEEKFLTGPQLTPDIEVDDCKQASAAKDTGRDKWFKSSLSKRYTKSPTTINALRAAGRLIEK